MPAVKAVLLTHNETSTGVMNPIPELAAAIRDERPDALILVDSVSGLGAVPFEMDAWGVDVVVTGSQKAWMSAPGPGHDRGVAARVGAMETATMPRFYLDLRAHRDAAANGQTPFTPAIAVVFQVDEGLRLMGAEGAEAIFARHEACAAAARAGLEALGFELFADPRHASRTVTAAHVPDGLDWKAFNTDVKAPRRRARRRPGQAHRQDLPARSPRLGDRSRRSSARSAPSRSSRSSRAGRSSPGRRSPRPSAAALATYGHRRDRRGRGARA